MQVAKAAIAALGQQHALPDHGQIGNHRFFVFVDDLGAHRHAQQHVIAVAPRALAAHAVLAIVGKEMLLIAEIDQRVQPLNGLDPDRAAIAAIAAIRAAEFNELLAPERDAAATARAGADIDFGKIEKFHRTDFHWFRPLR